MLSVVEKPVIPPEHPKLSAHRQKAAEIRKGVRTILQEAIEIKAIAFDSLKKLHATIDSQDQEAAIQARAMAQAVTTLIKGWETGVEAIRIARGKPLPGSLRPESKPKKSKSTIHTFSESKPE